MKWLESDSAISEVMAVLMLVLVAVSVSAAYYTWIANLQEEVQTTGSQVADTRLDTFLSEIEVIAYPEYEYYNMDRDSDGRITVNSTTDERFIQEIKVVVVNKALFNLTRVKVKAVSFGGGVDWAALHFTRSTVPRYDRKLLDREEGEYRLNGELVYFTSENKTNTSMSFFTDEGYPFFAANSSGAPLNTTSITDLTPLHNPTYTIGNISKGEHGTGYVYLLINHSALPVESVLKLYVTTEQGVDAYKTIRFSIQ